ncbi:hypothetical protein LVD17_27830 [Fulvivirga ulvae]|uniref:hypothetical protein n=1 Tax=Fulvivirga ulvae TaxID=2904245 RepID=UPI001F352B4F|nr:hypothetical protein [Fulvivirga ulvae]UII32098.1 hypothetical protein LVD17_27830 [Fulvivirga ulvae]
MGYMGFGMRKEVYTRKPKTAFEKVKKLYDQEFKKNGKNYTYQHCDPETLGRICKKVRQQKKKLIFIQLSIFVVLAIAFVLITSAFFINQNYTPKTIIKATKPNFKTVTYWLDSNRTLKIEYYKFGPRCAVTNYKNDLKHQNTESYYQSGEQFRSAVYFYDTLVTEVYFYRNGDTIKNFPTLTDDKVYHIKSALPNSSRIAEFDFYDGKIVKDSYFEASVKQ